jgi:hypothetical protein
LDEEPVEKAWACPTIRQNFIDSQSMISTKISERLSQALEEQETDDLTRPYKKHTTIPLELPSDIDNTDSVRRIRRSDLDDLATYEEDLVYHHKQNSMIRSAPERSISYISPQAHHRNQMIRTELIPSKQIILHSEESLYPISYSAPILREEEVIVEDEFNGFRMAKRMRRTEVSHSTFVLPQETVIYQTPVYLEMVLPIIQEPFYNQRPLRREIIYEERSPFINHSQSSDDDLV